MPAKDRNPFIFSKEFHPPMAVGAAFHLHSLWSGRLRKPYRPPADRVQSYDLFYVATGGGELRAPGERKPLKSGVSFLALSDSGVELVPNAENGLSFSQVRFAFQESGRPIGDDAIIRENLPLYLLSPVETGADTYSAWNALTGELRAGDVFHESMLELLLRLLLIYFYRSCVRAGEAAPAPHAAGGRESVVDEVIRYIDANILYLKNVSKISEALGYNYSYLSHTFSEATGTSLRDYFLTKRFEKAIELLKDDMSITEVSNMLGYAAVHSFSRAFTRQIGRSPGSFQQKDRQVTRQKPLRRVFDNFEGDSLEWEADRVYGSMQTIELVPYPRHSGTRSLAMEFNVTSYWRVDCYARRRPDFSIQGMKYLSFWAKATSLVTVEIVLTDSQWQTFTKTVDIGNIGAVICLPLDEFVPKDETHTISLTTGVGLHFFFRSINNTEKPSIGRLFLDDVEFTDTDISMLTESSSKNDLLEFAPPESPFLLPPAVIARPRSQSELNRLCQGDSHPTGVQLALHENLTVYSVTGTPLGTLSSLFVKIYQKLLPVFTVSDKETVDALMGYLNEKNFQDVFVMSTKPDLLRHVHKQYYSLRGILEFTDELPSPDELHALCNENHIRILMLPEDTPRSIVSALQLRQTTVWLQQFHGEENLDIRYHRMLTSGASGLLVDHPERLAGVVEKYGGRTMLHTPRVISYGYEQVYPWDSLEAAAAAYEDSGAEFAILDIFFTKDRRLIAFPEREIERHSLDKLGNVEDYTWEELRKIRYNQNPHLECLDTHPALLEDFYRFFAPRSLRLFLVVYEDEERIIDQLEKLTREAGMEDRVSYVVGGTAQIQHIRRKIPRASVFTRGLYGHDCRLSLSEILTNLQLHTTQFSPRYDHSANLSHIIYNLWCRGISSWTYYIDNGMDFREYFLSGVTGLFTNQVHTFCGWMKELSFDRSGGGELHLRVGESRPLRAVMTTYSQADVLVSPQITVLSGGLRAEGNCLYAEEPGDGAILLWYEQSTALRCDKNSSPYGPYRRYTQPIIVHVNKPSKGQKE